MQEAASILSPAGFIMDVSVVAPTNGVGTYGPTFVAPLLPGAAFHTRGTGVFPLASLGLSGRQGTIQVGITPGATGSARAIVFLALSPTVMLGIALDSTNRPYAILKNAAGTTVGQSTAEPGTIAAGTPLALTLAWNSQGVVANGINAALLINSNVVSWGTVPNAVWTPFVPTAVYVGTTLGALGLSDALGTIGTVQISDQVAFFPPVGADVAESFTDSAQMSGNSTMSLHATVVYQGGSTMAGDSTMDADGTLIGP
jgi:hypothetical protein